VQWTTCACILINSVSGQRFAKFSLGEIKPLDELLPTQLKEIKMLTIQMCIVTFLSVL
jgi:hypothetical protein